MRRGCTGSQEDTAVGVLQTLLRGSRFKALSQFDLESDLEARSPCRCHRLFSRPDNQGI